MWRRPRTSPLPEVRQFCKVYMRLLLTTSLSSSSPVAVVSPGVFPRPPPVVSAYTTRPVPAPVVGLDPALLTVEREEKAKYHRMYEAKKKECSSLLVQLTALQNKARQLLGVCRACQLTSLPSFHCRWKPLPPGPVMTVAVTRRRPFSLTSSQSRRRRGWMEALQLQKPKS